MLIMFYLDLFQLTVDAAMYPSVALLAVFLADFVLLVSSYNVQYWDYIVVGAGPAGLQSAYHLQQAGRNYVVLEQANCTGE